MDSVMTSIAGLKLFGIEGYPLLALAIFGPVAIFVLWHVVEYYRDPLNLRKFPAAGKGIAGWTSSWVMYYCWQQKRTLTIDEAHKQLGSEIIRIQPDHISFSNGEAIQEIYGHGKDLMKAPFYDTLVAPTYMRSMFDTQDRVQHGEKRKYVAHLFAPKTVNELEESVAEITKSLFKILDKFADTKQAEWVDLLVWVRLYALDIVSNVSFGKRQNCLETGSDMFDAETPAGKKYKVSAVKGTYDGGAYNVFWGQAPSWMWLTKALTWWTEGRYYADGFFNISVSMVKSRVPKEDVEAYERSRRLDLFHRLIVDKNGGAMNLEMDELIAEAAVLMIAGSDTSGTGLINTLIYLTQNPAALKKLRAELDAALPVGTVVARHTDVQNLPYLRACVDEALRLRPPNAYGLPRIVSKNGARVQGHDLKPGTIVSVSTVTLHHREKYFKDPAVFNPDRWLDKSDPQQYENLRKYVIPFSFGSRACVGRNLAFMELLVGVASILNRYDLEMEHPDRPVPMLERFNTNPANFIVKIRHRTRPDAVAA